MNQDNYDHNHDIPEPENLPDWFIDRIEERVKYQATRMAKEERLFETAKVELLEKIASWGDNDE